MKPGTFWVCKISWDALQAQKATALSPALDKLVKAGGKKVEDLLTTDGGPGRRRKRESVFDNFEPQEDVPGREGPLEGEPAWETQPSETNEASGRANPSRPSPPRPSAGAAVELEEGWGAGAWWDPPPSRRVRGLYDESGAGVDDETEEGAPSTDEPGRRPASDGPLDVVPLSDAELDRVLPVFPLASQAAYFSGGTAGAVQRWGASLAATVVLSKAALLAAASLTWPVWWPWALAARRNWALRRGRRHAGLWRTRVLDVDPGSRGGVPAPRLAVARFAFGERGGPCTRLDLPADGRFQRVRPGDPAELLVLSSSPEFDEFQAREDGGSARCGVDRLLILSIPLIPQAVKDVYLPNSGLWLSSYPFLDRSEFLALSLAIEREAVAGVGRAPPHYS
ncbi:hypothetical protein APUTEX25_003353 [Auxenochlorella protothecoides]|uniref:Uncharacterized protein n=1 Tax=Auxenochlorella protothecoides TaxID=3075 RepID=A0A3M7KSN0_AUXPR|nr:hypothetical protein APUTEX25_003353 [Auxenochlorella protothecoides]|eukprot:RMZ53531.1 hypothetical protein APUTEX25_003353 [Auxenochlorella protothecoides]